MLTGIYDKDWNPAESFTDGSPITTEFLNSLLLSLEKLGGVVATKDDLPAANSVNDGTMYVVLNSGATPPEFALAKNDIWVYSRDFGAVAALDPDSAGSDGTSSKFARADHVHALTNVVKGNTGLTVGDTPPGTPAVNDLWVDTSV